MMPSFAIVALPLVILTVPVVENFLISHGLFFCKVSKENKEMLNKSFLESSVGLFYLAPLREN
jgi:hypothetical protein